MSAGSDPSAWGALQLSPDRKWLWDGKQWLPVAAPAAGPLAPVAPPIQAAVPVAEPVAVPVAPAPAYVVPYPAKPPEPQAAEVPLWEQRPSTGLNKYLYGVAGVVVLLIAALYLNSLGTITLPWMATAESRPTPKPTPPLTERSDYARADRFLSALLAPALADMNQSIGTLQTTCGGAMTVSCQSALVGADSQIKSVLSMVDRERVPTCIAAPVSKIRSDLASMDAAVKIGLQGYKDNQNGALTQALSGFSAAGKALTADVNAANAQKASCDTQIVGP